MPKDPGRLKLDTGKLDAKSPLRQYGLKTVIAALRNGATISDDYRAYIKIALKSRLAMYDRAKDDRPKAMAVYQDGVVLDIIGKHLPEFMDDTPPSPYRIAPRINLMNADFAGLGTVAAECNAHGKAAMSC